MKRFLICLVGVGLLVAPALAQQPAVSVWIQGANGENKLTLGVSETAVIQLWASISETDADGNNNSVVSLSAALAAFDAGFNPGAESVNIIGFNDQVISNSQAQRVSRGPNIDDLIANNGKAAIAQYFYVAGDPTVIDGTDGIQGDDAPGRNILLDEIIIHAKADNSGVGSDFIVFNPANAPAGDWMNFSVFGGWTVDPLVGIVQGTGSQTAPFLVNTTPEPATLGLIALGGFALIRRRR